MRARLILGLVVAVLLIPQEAWATCVEVPFDRVVRQSDAVLLGTIAGYHVEDRTVVYALDVESVLKGTAQDGARVVIPSCGPVLAFEYAKKHAGDVIGTRGLFLLTVRNDGLAYNFSEIATPQMTLDQKIARAREVLGLRAPILQPWRPRFPWWFWPLTDVVAALVVGGTVFVVRHRRPA